MYCFCFYGQGLWAFAKSGCDISIIYYNEDEDALFTKNKVEAEGRKCLLIKGDIKDSKFCKNAIENTLTEYKKINILVNNSAVQYVQDSLLDIDEEQFDKTFKTNVYGAFVEILPGKEGLLHISHIAHERVAKVEDVLNIGDEVEVKVTEIDEKGRVNLSRKVLLPKPEKIEKKEEK